MSDVAIPVFKKRVNKTSNVRKRPNLAAPEASASSESEYTDTDDESGKRVKRRKTAGVSIVNNPSRAAQDLVKSTVFVADRSAPIALSEDATKASSWYSDAALTARDAKDHSAQPASDRPTSTQPADGAYLGTAKYTNFIQKNPDRQVGPVKAAPSNVRAITLTDFAPDVCKDYKQTGFCGFGDNCKFLHMREDYKQGWQLDKEWESAGKKDRMAKANAGSAAPTDGMDEEEKMLQQIPFACIICKESYKMPVITKCGHYFCERCAMQRYMKEKKKTCAACGADTHGSFGVAKKLKHLLERKRLRAEESAIRSTDDTV